MHLLPWACGSCRAHASALYVSSQASAGGNGVRRLHRMQRRNTGGRQLNRPIGVRAAAPRAVIDRLDRHQETVVAKYSYGPEERQRLLDKVNRLVANLTAPEPEATGAEDAEKEFVENPS
jgi:hypothetical protein